MRDPWRRFEDPSSVFEKNVLANSMKMFQPSNKKWLPGAQNRQCNQKMGRKNSLLHKPIESDDEEAIRTDISSIWWWQPNKKSLFVEFCNETSAHGLKYVTKPRRHLSER